MAALEGELRLFDDGRFLRTTTTQLQRVGEEQPDPVQRLKFGGTYTLTDTMLTLVFDSIPSFRGDLVRPYLPIAQGRWLGLEFFGLSQVVLTFQPKR